ncbi:hypothetical protein PTKIN_Ptkin01aG0303600 [Pterospermum kingtungense]
MARKLGKIWECLPSLRCSALSEKSTAVERVDSRNVIETFEVELAREKAETGRMARWLKVKKRAVKKTKKNMQRIKRVNEQMFWVNRRMQNMVDDFLVAADAENNDPQTATIWT